MQNSKVWCAHPPFDYMAKLSNITQAIAQKTTCTLQLHSAGIQTVDAIAHPWIPHTTAFVRSSSLCAPNPVTYSEVIISTEQYLQNKEVLDALENNPIGTFLLYKGNFSRSSFEFASIHWPSAQAILGTTEPVAVRRSMFTGPFTVYLIESFCREFAWSQIAI